MEADLSCLYTHLQGPFFDRILCRPGFNRDIPRIHDRLFTPVRDYETRKTSQDVDVEADMLGLVSNARMDIETSKFQWVCNVEMA